MQNAPDLHMGLEIYMAGFLDLHSCRNSGMGLGTIPWTAIFQYCGLNRMDEEQMDNMFYFIREMDNFYLKYKKDEKQ